MALVDDLSDVELRVRLSQRGVPTLDARWLVDHREEPEARTLIDEWLAPGRGDRE